MSSQYYSALCRAGRASKSSVVVCVFAAAFFFAAVADASAISCPEVMARAQRWVDLAVPYSQTSFFEGYRQDCSGFVSMAWRLTWPSGAARSLATDTLPGVCTPITREDLRPGDAIIRPKTATVWGHAVIFGGWSNAARTHYWAFEASNSAGGTRMRETPYPYWAASGVGFAPYRFNGIEEDLGAFIDPVAGACRYETAVAASRRAFPDPAAVETIVIATGESWPDALSGAGLAGAVKGPVLLTRRSALPASVRAEIVRLAPARAIVIGGEGAVAEDVAEAIGALGVRRVDRVAGTDRYETSAAVARVTVAEARAASPGYVPVVYVATGTDFPDALAAAPVSAFLARPVLLVHPSGVPTATAAALADISATRAFIVGGESAVYPAIASELATHVAEVRRLAGADRYSTALAVAGHGVSAGLTRANAGLATGVDFADALAGGAAQGLSAPASVLYLTPPSRLPEAVRAEISTHRAAIGRVRVYGGVAAVPDSVRVQVAAALRGW
ncbi:MAG: cell wall-binding repeat-containing protein [Clostridiales bacterium]|nr:cell wall-binding repeat-containing protein [Clostridiales bacterium]